jgi:hypothetical protein
MSSSSPLQAAPIVGLVVGLALGLAYTWVIEPVEVINTYPTLLRTVYRWDWVRLTALSYVADGDLERARARIAGIKQEDIAGAMETLIEEYAAAGHSADTLRRLTTLAEALDVHTPAMLVYSYGPTLTPSSPPDTPSPSPTPAPNHTPTPHAPPPPTVTATPIPTPTPVPTLYAASPLSTPTPEFTDTPPPPTPTPPLLARLHLSEREQICEPEQTPHIEVVVRDEEGTGVSGVEVWLIWSGGADRAVTGLKPEYGAGYVDFDAGRGAPGSVNYSLGIGELGMPLVNDLRIEFCPAQADETPLVGSWRLVLEPRPLETSEPEATDES